MKLRGKNELAIHFLNASFAFINFFWFPIQSCEVVDDQISGQF